MARQRKSLKVSQKSQKGFLTIGQRLFEKSLNRFFLVYKDIFYELYIDYSPSIHRREKMP